MRTRWMRTRMRCTSPGTPTGRWPKSTRVPRRCWRSTKIQRAKKRSRCRYWNSSGREVSPWPPISWASAGGRGGRSPDDEQAELWFRRAADAGYDFAQYALGRLLQSQKRMDEAVSWYEKAAAQGNSWAAYRLGKLYLEEKMFRRTYQKQWPISPSPPNRATSTPSTLWESCTSPGRMSNRIGRRPGRGSVNRRNRETSTPQFFLDHFDQAQKPNVSSFPPPDCSTTWARSFGNNSVPPAARWDSTSTENAGGRSRKNANRHGPQAG